MSEKEGRLGFVSEQEFAELKKLALVFYGLQSKLEGWGNEIDAQENPLHQGAAERGERVRRAANWAIALFKRQNDPQARQVSWEEYIDLKTELKSLISLADPNNEILKE